MEVFRVGLGKRGRDVYIHIRRVCVCVVGGGGGWRYTYLHVLQSTETHPKLHPELSRMLDVTLVRHSRLALLL